MPIAISALQMFGCRKKMSAIAILDYSGAEAVYHHMESLAKDGRQSWVAHHGSSTTSCLPSQPQSSAAQVHSLDKQYTHFLQ